MHPCREGRGRRPVGRNQPFAIVEAEVERLVGVGSAAFGALLHNRLFIITPESPPFSVIRQTADRRAAGRGVDLP